MRRIQFPEFRWAFRPRVEEPWNVHPQAKARVVELLKAGNTLTEAAQIIHWDRKTIYAWRQTDPEFDRAVRLALNAGRRARIFGPFTDWPDPDLLIEVPKSKTEFYRIRVFLNGVRSKNRAYKEDGPCIDLRQFFSLPDGKLLPTRRGLMMKPGKVQELIPKLEQALELVKAACAAETAQER